MTNKELLQALSVMRGLLYRCPFSGDQMMVVSECVRIIDTIAPKINESNLDTPMSDQHEE